MNEQEINILNYIKNHGSFERPVPLKLLKSEFKLSERGIKEIIEHLRCDLNSRLLQAVEQNAAAITCQKTIWSATQV